MRRILFQFSTIVKLNESFTLAIDKISLKEKHNKDCLNINHSNANSGSGKVVRNNLKIKGFAVS